MAAKHKVTAVVEDGVKVDGEYLYRGITIERNDSCKGYWGYWSARIRVGNATRVTTSTRARLLAEIDLILNARDPS